MSGSVNKVILIGHLGADPEIRRTQDGRAIATLRLATSESWRDKNSGERREKTEWHTVVIFNEGLAKIAEQYLKKGSKAYVEGQLATRKWQDRDGNDRWSTEVVLQGFGGSLTLLDRREGSGYRAGGDPDDYGYDADRAAGPTSSAGGAPARNMGAGLDDDIPFAPEWRG
ncbi:single-stranded DNA-binding protein [Rhizobium sp. SSA_523]|uniref:single-stranded DNA-binding protein n=1 Tax=Rhizobium sp. SSA_523 TaxID=2952477 RepID=UPI0020918660|nr:single-stranded DNA-binding protein [Rhizobium sp. SSA_523]MCO5734099.1 single-stranded DNA-binding protein [Rhizobium sp. SSA_523]WKC24737.1 single-stranded DNA-binding protein [Rhizobium sp. SSA_523]